MQYYVHDTKIKLGLHIVHWGAIGRGGGQRAGWAFDRGVGDLGALDRGAADLPSGRSACEPSCGIPVLVMQ